MILESAGFSNGRIQAIRTASGATYTPNYFLTDHLGSVRAIVAGNGEIIEHNNYYPFGMRWSDPESAITDNRYRYNGKEEQNFVNVPYIDYGARTYDSRFRLGWNGIDPLAEQRFSISSYGFNQNTPINRVDRMGMLDDEWEIISGPDSDPQLTRISDKGGNQIQYIHSFWDSGSGDLWDLGTDVWENWPNNELAMVDILSGGNAALGPWNHQWWKNASGRLD